MMLKCTTVVFLGVSATGFLVELGCLWTLAESMNN